MKDRIYLLHTCWSIIFGCLGFKFKFEFHLIGAFFLNPQNPKPYLFFPSSILVSSPTRQWPSCCSSSRSRCGPTPRSRQPRPPAPLRGPSGLPARQPPPAAQPSRPPAQPSGRRPSTPVAASLPLTPTGGDHLSSPTCGRLRPGLAPPPPRRPCPIRARVLRVARTPRPGPRAIYSRPPPLDLPPKPPSRAARSPSRAAGNPRSRRRLRSSPPPPPRRQGARLELRLEVS
jgi:hypothetical protein